MSRLTLLGAQCWLSSETENEMLDLLGRSKDLDDERAIDLLAEARNLQASVNARNKEIAEVRYP